MTHVKVSKKNIQKPKLLMAQIYKISELSVLIDSAYK